MAPSQDSERKAAPADLGAAVPDRVAGLSDEERLAQLGHKQELDRNFSRWAVGCVVALIMATWEAVSAVLSTALVSGGPPCLFYNYLLAFAGTMAIVFSLGEIASIYPTAGGQYHWVAVLAPEKRRSLASWATGWISVTGQIVICASAAFTAGLTLQSLIVIHDESYDRPRWQGMLFYWAVLVYSAVVNIFGIKLLPNINLAAGVLHIAGLAAVMVTLGVMGEKSAASFVFTQVSNSSGWASDGIAWLVGLQSAVFPMLGYDAACHLAEELPNPSRNVPLAMIWGVAVNCVLGLAYTILILFVTSPLEALLATPTGFPFMQIFLDVTRSRGGTIVLSLIPSVIAVVATIASMASTSRTLWAFARDDGVPFSRYFSHVDSTFHVPARAVGILTVLQLLLGLIYLGNVTAYNALLSLAIIGSYLSYMAPIWYMIFYGRSMLHRHQYGSFSLGRGFGYALNIFAVMWMVLVIVFSMFPLTMPVTADNMNYASVVLIGWLLVGIGYYYVGGGKNKFVVPYRDVQVLDDVQAKGSEGGPVRDSVKGK